MNAIQGNHHTIHEADTVLIDRILQGSRRDLKALIVRYQGWIYNVALKMTLDHHDAEDVTQEILIKLITKLATYDRQKASFRTWLYRIVANHVLNMRKRKYEQIVASFEACETAIMQVPDETMDASPESTILAEELKIKCLTGLLLCLDRRHRLIFIMSEIFDISNAEGSAILDVTEANYRKALSRGRRKVFNFINRNCGLIHPDNPCHCRKQLKGLIRLGFVDPDHLVFYKDKVKTIEAALYRNKEGLERICDTEQTRRLYKMQPFYDPPDFENHIGKYLSTDLQRLFRE